MYYMIMRYSDAWNDWELMDTHQTFEEANRDYEAWKAHEPHGKFRMVECRNLVTHG
jgi:hypothetical protein